MTVVSPTQFEKHVQNTVASVEKASPEEHAAGLRWYPEAHKEAYNVAKGNPAGVGDYESKGRRVYTSADSMKRATGEIAALSPARPSGMRWEYNPGAAHQIRDVTPEQHAKVSEAVGLSKAADQAAGKVKAARNRGEPTAHLEDAETRARAAFRDKSAEARAPFKGTDLGHAGVRAINKAYQIHHGMKPPEEALGEMKERHFYHDILKPYTAHIVFHGQSGTVDQHQANVMEGRHGGWTDNSARSHPDVGKPKGYQYGRDVLHEAAGRLGLRPNAAQPISWIHQKNATPRKGRQGTV